MVKKCPSCGTSVEATNKFCKNCGFKIIDEKNVKVPQKETYQTDAKQEPVQKTQPIQYQNPNYSISKKHTGAGVASLILGIIPMCLIWICFIPGWGLVFYLVVELTLGILATIFGAVSYFGKAKDKFGLAGFILGILVLVLGLVFSIITFVGLLF